MNRNSQDIMQPGQALTGLLFALAFGAFWFWLARHPGWEVAWLGVFVGAALVLDAWRKLVQAHRADKERRRRAGEVDEPQETYETRRPPAPPGDNWPA